MQNLVPSDNKSKNNNNTTTSSMPPQVQAAQMQSIHQPFSPLSQLNQLQQWQPTDQPQGQLQIPLAPVPASPKLSSNASKPTTSHPPSPTSLSMVTASTGFSKGSSKTKGSRGPSSPNGHHGIKRGSGVEIKGPTPEVAQQLRFPWKLHLLLERCEYEHQQKMAAYAAEGKNPASIPDMPISWLPDGKSFKVHDKERFVREVMPSFFGTQSFKTFQRNLNLWGFTRVSKGPQKDVCSHPLFLKGFPAVCQSMKRIVLKGTGRGNRAPLGGVDVSSVQAVVAAAAMQQAQQQAQQQVNGISQVPHHVQAQQVLQQQQIQAQSKNDVSGLSQHSTLNHVHHQNQQPQIATNQQQQPQFVIENGSIHAAPIPSQQKLVVLPSQSNPNASATTTVMWPNQNQPLQQMQQQPFAPTDAGNLQKSLQQLSAIIQQLNGCNANSSATVNMNSVNTNNGSNNSVNTNNFQQQQQQLQVGPTPLPIMMQQQQPVVGQQQPQFQVQQSSNPNMVVAPAPMSTQDLVTLLLQRNLQQQVSQVQASNNQQQQPQAQIQLPASLFPSAPFSVQQQQQPVVNGSSNFGAASPTAFLQPQQQGSMGNNANVFQQQPQAQPPVAAPSPTPQVNNQTQQQNQLLQLLMQQNGWSTNTLA